MTLDTGAEFCRDNPPEVPSHSSRKMPAIVAHHCASYHSPRARTVAKSTGIPARRPSNSAAYFAAKIVAILEGQKQTDSKK
ncbi:hypothetical protein [Paracoccus onubensis]|uniref:hypothetical protein n=1 Tax=Paracoccus onubensis TaxID=1675788 RepID=UPI0011C49C95|nr:hypothetical protein [Paracoccus onubensis]